MPGLPLLDALLPQQIFAFFLIFARVGALFMLMPGVGEAFVTARFRLCLALAVSFVLLGPVSGLLPALPDNPGVLALLLGVEILIGIAIGTAGRLLFSALNVAGNTIALQMGLASAINFDPTLNTQGAIVSTFLTTLAIMLLFVTNTHQLLFGALVHSYQLFPPGAAPSVHDFLELITRFVSGSFLLGIELSIPFLVLSLVFYAGLGVVAKMMPQFQVFFISMPLSILAGFGLLMVLTGLMMDVFMDHFADQFGAFVR